MIIQHNFNFSGITEPQPRIQARFRFRIGQTVYLLNGRSVIERTVTTAVCSVNRGRSRVYYGISGQRNSVEDSFLFSNPTDAFNYARNNA